MLRSEPMTLCRLIERNDMARTLVEALGSLSLVQFRDLNGETPLHRRSFSDDVKRCDELSRRLAYIASEFEAAGLSASAAAGGSPTADAPAGRPPVMSLADLEPQLRQVHDELRESRSHQLQPPCLACTRP